ncbi:MAG: DUF3792 family protein [Oscillospiraceae bacterium]|nr:DUF3792 family protein [Oscillospiraceae bacterium]
MQKIMKAKTRRGERSIAEAFGKGLFSALIAQLLLLALGAALMSGGVIPESVMHIMAAVCAALSSFVGAFICASSAPKLTLPLAMAVGAAQLALNFALGMLLAGGDGFTPLIPAAFIIGSVAAGVISAVKTGRK